jgi:putative tricarboxylic transport membrane protein
MLAISSPRRLKGDAAGVPTWRELGVNAVSSNWRAVVGPKALPAAQIAYWDETFSAMVQTPEWLQVLRKNQWEQRVSRQRQHAQVHAGGVQAARCAADGAG